MGGQYVLADTVNDKVYRLVSPALAIRFVGKRVRVRGIADDKGIFSIIDIENR
jgi:hypothetical protein